MLVLAFLLTAFRSYHFGGPTSEVTDLEDPKAKTSASAWTLGHAEGPAAPRVHSRAMPGSKIP